MSEQQQREPSQPGWTPMQDAKQAANMFVFVAHALCSPVEVILRKQFGSRYFGAASLGGLVAVPMWMIFWPGEDPGLLMCFWLFYLVMQFRARVESHWMLLRGSVVHSRYNGWPRIARFLPKSSEDKIKGGAEPTFVCLSGMLLMGISPPLGSYLLVAGVALAVTHSVLAAVERVQAIEMHDSFIEQQQLSSRFNAMRGNRRR